MEAASSSFVKFYSVTNQYTELFYSQIFLRFLQALTTEFNLVKFSVIMNGVSYLKRIFHPYSISVCHPGS